MTKMFKKKIAFLLAFAMVLIHIDVFAGGDMEVSITPILSDTLEAYGAEEGDEGSTIDPDLDFELIDPASQQNYDGGMVTLSSAKKKMTLVVRAKDGALFPNEIEKIEWSTFDTDDLPIIKLEEEVTTDNKPRQVTIEAINPGYTSIWVKLYYPGGDTKDLMCQVHVKLEIDSFGTATSVNPYIDKVNTDEWRGMKKDGIFTNTEESKTLQLSTSEDFDMHGGVQKDFGHYLVKISNVQYESGVTWETTVEEGKKILTNPAALDWSSSDHAVCTVDENGIVTAIGAGYAEVKVTTKTSGSDNGKEVFDTASFHVLVAPKGKLSTSDDDKKGTISSLVVPSKTFTIETNAKVATGLDWTIQKFDKNGEKLNIENNPYMKVDISDYSGVITFSDVKAGVYYVTANPNGEYAKVPSGAISRLTIRIIVPLFVNSGEVLMNVGDTYDILSNSNIHDKSLFNYTTKETTVIGINGGIISALSEGEATATMTYIGSGGEDIYKGLSQVEKELIKLYSNYDVDEKQIEIPVQVIDEISMSVSSATIYVGHELQLNVNASNQFSPVTWTSSDAAIASVDEFGLVKGLKPGTIVITATQVINGVTKTARCEIKVVQTVTEITIDPSNANIAIGEYLTLNATAKPASTSTVLHWVSSDSSIVEITSSDKLSATVKALKGGTVVISAINQDNVTVGSCLIKVHEPIKSITLSEKEVKISLADKFFYLYATVLPANAADREVVWRSTDESIIKVDQSGKVTPVKSGNAAVVVTAKDDASIMAICNVIVTKSVTGIKLDTARKDMYVGESFRLSYSVSPSDASNADIIWTSTNPGVAAVDGTGLISAKSVGSATIIAKTKEGGYTAMCQIHVSRTATAVKLDVTKLTLNVGDSYLLETIITPADATETNLSWESSDTSVAVVSKRGKVTAKKAGTCVILVKTKSGSTGYCSVTVFQGVSGIEISSSEETIEVGETLELEADVIPASATNQKITWSSSNTDVAYVNNKGEVKGLQGGIAIITCKAADGGYVDTCIVTVEEMVRKIELNETSYRLGLGKSFKLEATVTGEKASDKSVGFASSNSSIASVDENGVVKGNKLGKATITCSAEDGSGAEAYCEVEVVNLVSNIALNETYITLIQGKSYTLKATVSPNNATYKTPIWTSSDTDIAIVNNKGVITGLKPGDCIITAAADDSSGISTVCYVRVIAPVPASGVTPQESEVIMSPGESRTVGISLVPSNSTDTYTWSCDNPAVATVDAKTGKITAVALGTANITIMTESGRKGTITVYVVGLSRTYVEIQQYTSLLVKLEVDGADASKMNVRWDVDNQEIATVTNGRITGRALGTTTVYATVNGRRLPCTVKVVKIK